MKTKTGAGMKTTSIRTLLLSLGLAAFPLSAMSATSNGSPLRVDESAHALEAQTKVNPFDATALNNEAVKMSRDGNQLDALQLLLRAHRLAPDDKKIERNFKDLNGWMAKRTSATQTLDINKSQIPAWPEPPPLWNSPANVSASQAPSTKASAAPRSHSRARTSHSYSRVRSHSSTNSNLSPGSNPIAGSASVPSPGTSLNSGSRYNLDRGSVSGNGSLQGK